jgi:hypothetical protein
MKIKITKKQNTGEIKILILPENTTEDKLIKEIADNYENSNGYTEWDFKKNNTTRKFTNIEITT